MPCSPAGGEDTEKAGEGGETEVVTERKRERAEWEMKDKGER